MRPVNPPQWLPTPAQRRARAANACLHGLAEEILQTCGADPDRDAPLVRALLAATDPQTGRLLSDSEICHELVLFMLAGHDTTSTTLTYALWALGHHREVQDRVAAEVAELGDDTLTPEDVPRLGYTVQVLHEALRLCPPAASVGRMVMQDIEVDGYRVDAGTFAVVGIYAMHRDPALWEYPLVFDPDRFSAERSKGRSRWQYLPFGAGPRSCIGDHFAMLEATLALATIVRQVEIRSLNDDFPFDTPFTLVAATPIRARVHKRARARWLGRAPLRGRPRRRHDRAGRDCAAKGQRGERRWTSRQVADEKTSTIVDWSLDSDGTDTVWLLTVNRLRRAKIPTLLGPPSGENAPVPAASLPEPARSTHQVDRVRNVIAIILVVALGGRWLSFATRMGPPSCHEDGTTGSSFRAS